MESRELRIGNLINFKTVTDLFYESNVVELKQNYIAVILSNGIYRDNKEQFEAIKLTENWILRFGFTKEKIVQINQHYNKGNFEIFEDDGKFYYLNLNFRTELKYVHQFQNLFYSITNVEISLSFC